jgi:outer membrane protein assembly complex protein YaeT
MLLACAWAVSAQTIGEAVGRVVASIAVTIDGVPVRDPQVLVLIEQAVGTPFSPAAVRESIFHLVNVGRYDNVRVEATPAGEALALEFVLVLRRQVSAVRFRGTLGLSEGALRDALDPRLRDDPTPARIATAERALAQLFESRGYLRATVAGSVVEVAGTLDQSEIVFDIDCGPAARIARIEADVDEPTVFGGLAARLGLVAGRPYDRQVVQSRLERELRILRDKGYLEARLSTEAEDQGDGLLVASLSAHLGPIVEVRFEGDPLPRDVREAQVPVRREASVDEDLLEDSQRNLERYLQDQGYSRAAVTYRREGDTDRRFVVFTVAKGPLFRVGRVRLSGNSAVPSAELEPLLGLAAGDLFTDAKLDSAESAVRRAYFDRGFADVRVSAAVDETLPEPPSNAGVPAMERLVDPRIVVAEGRRLIVSSLRFDGREALTEGALLEASGLSEGEPFVASRVIEGADRIDALYQGAGYRDAQVEPVVKRSQTEGGAEVTFRIVEGLRALAGQVIITGNRRIGTATIRREIALAPGDAIGVQQLVDIQRRVAALGLFRRVQVTEALQPGSTSRDVVVTVDESPPTTVGYGGGVEVGSQSVLAASGASDERVTFAWRTFFQVGRRNLFGKNRSVNLFTRASLRRKNEDQALSDQSLGFNEYRVIGSFQEPRAFNTTANAQVSGFLEQTIRASFSFVRKGAQAEMTHAVRRGVTLVGRYSYDNTRLFDERLQPADRPLIDRLFPRVTLSKVSIGALRDTRDGPLDPTRGALLGFDQTLAIRTLGSEVGFAKTFLQASVYRRMPRTERVVWAARAQVGLAHGFAQTTVGQENADDTTAVSDLPASERFFAGGAITVRGFALDRLGDASTLRDDGFPTGGNGMVVINTELRLPVWKSLGAALFLDAGNVFQNASDISLGDLRASPGLGLRYRSPLGPVRVDLGFKLDRRRFRNGEREQLTAFHISIGQAF